MAQKLSELPSDTLEMALLALPAHANSGGDCFHARLILEILSDTSSEDYFRMRRETIQAQLDVSNACKPVRRIVDEMKLAIKKELESRK